MNDPIQDRRVEAVANALQTLGEYFEAVQIMCCFTEENATKMRSAGSGNWFARQGMAREFLQAQQDQALAAELSEALKPDSEP